jgi:teichuronic acid biosynthesis glycosyltransferase TuaC
VAATDVGDIRRSLPACQAPSLSAPDARSLAQALTDLYANRARSDAWGAANRAHALEHFSPQTMQARWNQVFDGYRSNHAGATAPRVLVFSSLFPCPSSPQSGIFIKERMFRVARQCPLVVVAPRSWSPFDGLIRLFRPTFRPLAPRYEHIEGIDIHRPTFFSLPGLLKRLDGWSMAQGSRKVMQQLQRHFEPTLVDAHFVYPDGYAASVLAKEQGLPLTITLRGSKDEWLIGTSMEPALRVALDRAQRIFSVSDALKRDVGLKLGQAPEKLQTVRNGVDLGRFHAEDRLTARARFGLRPDDQVIVSAGWLIERKGFHRIIPLLEQLAQRHARVKLMIVGSGTSQEDMGPALHELAQRSGVADRVLFCGALAPDEMRWGYSAGDVFALATSHEGWANVFLEAMACGLPVITTQVGGNQQVVSHPGVGCTVPYWDAAAFTEALDRALGHTWDRQAITEHAQRHSWEEPIRDLVGVFTAISKQRA